jgi:hypothetical protein
VPRVEREEFLNVGVILYCRDKKFLDAKFKLDKARLQAFPNLAAEELEEIEANLEAYCRISKGEKGSGPIGELPPHERFRWLTATRSTIVQTSKVHPGFSADPEETLERLFREMVL